MPRVYTSVVGRRVTMNRNESSCRHRMWRHWQEAGVRNTIIVLALMHLMGCGGGDTVSADSGGVPDGGGQDGGVGDAGSAGITLSGALVAGAQTPAAPPPISPSPAPAQGDPLVGYQLYCVTFATPPTAASGTADATGQLTLSLDALGVAFGCFVLDADGTGVASVIFMSGAQSGQTVTLTGDTDLGSITVDLDNGVAQTDVTSTGTITGSGGLACPLGEWVLSVPREDCGGGNATVSLWFVQDADGQYTASFTIFPVRLPGTDPEVCGRHSETDLPVTKSGGAFTFKFLNNPNCALVYDTLVATPNAGCTQLAVAGSIDGCMSCAEGQCGCGEGSMSCPQNFTATRK